MSNSDVIPSLYLLMSYSTKVSPGITSVLAAEEEVVVATKSGELIGVNWDGSLDESFRWEITDGKDASFNIVDMKYSSMIGGFSFVFYNGKIAYMPIHDQHTTHIQHSHQPQQHPQQLQTQHSIQQPQTFPPNLRQQPYQQQQQQQQQPQHLPQAPQQLIHSNSTDDSVFLNSTSTSSSATAATTSTASGNKGCNLSRSNSLSSPSSSNNATATTINSPSAPTSPTTTSVTCNGSPGANLSSSPPGAVVASASISSSYMAPSITSSSTSNLHSSHPHCNPHTGCATSTNPRRVMTRRTSMPNVSSRVQFVPDVANGVNSAINHKYQLVAYGLANSQGILCVIDDENSTVIITHHLILPSNCIPETILDSIGSLNTLSWSPDSMVLATAWQNGGIGLWSVFGSLLMCTLSWDYGSPNCDSWLAASSSSPSATASTAKYLSASSFAWGKEGYQLWFVSPNVNQIKGKNTSSSGDSVAVKSTSGESVRKMSTSTNPSTSNVTECNSSLRAQLQQPSEYLLQMSFAKSILATNPTITTVSREILLLTSEDKLYIGVASKANGSGNGSNGHNGQGNNGTFNGNTNEHNNSIHQHQQQQQQHRGQASSSSLSSSTSSMPNSSASDCNFDDGSSVNDGLNEKLSASEIGSHQWLIIPLNESYLLMNSPIRLTAVDSTGTLIAIAGRSGFTYYSLITKKWKLFVNENQEKSFEVYSSMCFYSNISLIVSCYNFDETSFEIRSYPLNERLDNQLMKKIKFNIEILHISIFGSKLLVMTADGVFTLISLNDAVNNVIPKTSAGKDGHNNVPNGGFNFNGASSSSSSLFNSSSGYSSLSSFLSSNVASSGYNSTVNSNNSFDLTILSTIVISNLIVPPESVISIFLTNLHTHSPSITSTSDISDNITEAILLNVSGRVMLLERDLYSDSTSTLEALKLPSINSGNSTLTSPIDSSCLNNPVATLIYRAVSTLASGVEHVWIPIGYSNCSGEILNPLRDSLWLSRGSNGLNIWLPLQPSRSFMSNRIMLPITTRIYPLGILIADTIIIGAENDTLVYNSIPLPVTLSAYSTIVRTSEVYLHHILRELLKRNLGIYAWEIANCCVNLTYFSHSLELLLHETLEEEATSSAPIPDALLPPVVAFIREFNDVFLSTIVQCARKTELALWPHLFSIVGNPKDLFTKCLHEGKLQIASSYLLILQNLEKTSVSRKYAMLLLEACLKEGKKNLAKEIKRYLDSTDPADLIA